MAITASTASSSSKTTSEPMKKRWLRYQRESEGGVVIGPAGTTSRGAGAGFFVSRVHGRRRDHGDLRDSPARQHQQHGHDSHAEQGAPAEVSHRDAGDERARQAADAVAAE